MSTFPVEASAEFDAPAEAVYAVLSDYRVGHPAILPRQYNFHLESGGTGAGTVFRLNMTILGRPTPELRFAVTEPEPGRVLMEKDVAGELFTTFTVEPLAGGRSRLVIHTEIPGRGGVAGWVERTMTRALLRPLYAKELRNLREYVTRPAPAAGGA